MNIITLELEAFGPFAKTCTIDFARTISGGLFLIQGPTGSGKTSILDAICYALYGESSGNERLASGLRSHHAAEDQATRVRLVFASGGKNYQVERWMSGRKSQTPNEKAILQELGPLETLILTDKRAEVAQRVTALIRLDQNQFRQVIILPQGRFRDFLVAKSQERQEILKNLFDTARLDDLVDRIVARRQDQEKAVASQRSELKFLNESLNLAADSDAGQFLARLEAKLRELETQYQAAQAVTTAARSRLESGRQDRQILANLAEAGQALANLSAQEPADQRRRLIAAESLRSLAHLPPTLARQEADLAGLTAILDGLERQIAERLAEKPRLGERVRLAGLEHDRIPALRQQLSRQQLLRSEMANFKNLQAQQAALEQDLATALATRNQTETMRNEQIAKREALQAERRSVREWAELPTSLETMHNQIVELAHKLETKQRLQHECQRLDQELIQAEFESNQLAGRLVARQAELQAIEQAYWGQEAARLASRLAPDQPCPVCGSSHHPSPAHIQGHNETAESPETVQRDIAALTSSAQSLAVRQALSRESRQRHGLDLAEAETAIAGHYLSLQALIAESTKPTSSDELAFAPPQPAEFRNFLEVLSIDLETRTSQVWQDLAETGQELLRRSQSAQRNASQLERQIASLDEHISALREKLHNETAAAAVLEERLANLAHQASERRASLSAAFEIGPHEFPGIAEMDSKIAAEEQRLVSIEQEREQARQALADLEMAINTAASRQQELLRQSAELAATRQQTRATWLHAIQERSFANETAALDALLSEPDMAALRRVIETWDQAHLLAVDRLSSLQKQAQGLIEPDLATLSAALEQAQYQESALERQGALAGRELEVLRAGLERLNALSRAMATAEASLESIAGLCKLLQGQDAEGGKVNLQRYALSVYLDDILSHANQHLQDMSRGRYELVREDIARDKRQGGGLELQILDAYTGSRRGTESLSGGESFIAALSLALGLSSVVHARAGGVRIDTLFVDEGFGSLDEEALQDAMTVLARLNDRGRTVGIISHVRELQERIPLQLVVQRTNSGSQAAWNSLISGPD